MLNMHNNSESCPHLIQEGMYGAIVHINQEPIHLRMERITQKNSADWSQFRSMSIKTSQEGRGALSVLVSWAGTKV